MAKKFICVEVGDRLVKVAVCLGVEKKRKVKNAFFFVPPEETVQDGLIIDPIKFAVELGEQLQANGGGDAKEIHFTISSSKVATREVKMPLLTDAKITTVVDNNKSEYFPLDITNYTVLFRVMTRVKKGDDKGCNVLVIAMPNSASEACANVANGLKLRLKGVDAVCSSIADGAASLNQSQITAYIHVDCTNTNMCFMRGNELLLQRTLSFGGEELITAYQETSGDGVSYIQALEDLTSMSAEDHIRGKLDEEDIAALLERAVGSIHRSVEFFNSNKGGGVTKLVLTGPCGGLLGLEELLEQATAVPTIQLMQLSTATSLRSVSAEPAYYIAVMYAGSNGLNFGKHLDPKNQKGKRAKGNGQLDMPTAIMIFILLMVFAVYWAYSAVLEEQQMQDELARLQTEVANMQYLYVISDTHTKYTDSKEELLNFTKMTENPNEDLDAFLAELEAKMPSEVLFLSAGCSANSVNLNVVVGSLVEAATVLSKLRTFDSIDVIQVSGFGMGWVQMEGSEFSQELNDGFEEISFSIICNYGTNPYTAGWNPYANILGIENVPTLPEASTDAEVTEPVT